MKDALAAHDNDREWLDEHDRVTREDWTVALLADAAKDLERAASTLYDDAETAAQIKALVEQLDVIYWRVHERDSKRRWRRSRADGSDPTIPLA